METDSLFLKGSGHILCEDYTTEWVTPEMAIAIVADGCSMSRKTDVGARVVAESLRASICDIVRLGTTFPEIPTILQVLASKLQSVEAALQLPEEALDATLLCAIASPKANRLELLMLGDGHIVWKTTSGETHHVASHYPSGAPFYFNYLLHPQRQESYRISFGEPITNAQKRVTLPDGTSTEEPLESGPHHFWSLPLDNIQWVALLSDGVDTFTSPDSENPIPVQEILTEITAFKNSAGEFVKRRMLRFQKECAKRNWSHHDDISCAAITTT